jgi:hypothetical protein
MSVALEQDTREVTAKGVKLRLTEAGAGRPVFAFGAGFAGSEAHRALATRFRVTAIESSETDALNLGEAAASLADGAEEKVGLLGIGAQSGAALATAQALGERASSLVLSSPHGLPLSPANEGNPLAPLLRGVLTPKLVMIGHDDKAMPKDALTLFRKGLSRSNVMLIYNAGADIGADRPQSFADVAGDFFDRQDRYRFMATSVAVAD